MRAVESEKYTAAQVVRITGVPYQTLNYWVTIGLVTPSLSSAHGSGSRRLFDFGDLLAIKVAFKLRQGGIFGSALVRIFEALRRAGFDSPAAVGISITPDGDVVVSPNDQEAFSVHRKPGQLLLHFCCDCRETATELRTLIVLENTSFTQTSPTPKRNPAKEQLSPKPRDQRRRA